jgi:hypothetical protein
MKPIEVFGKYAMAFEEAVRLDDWSVVGPFFTEDAVYQTLGEGPFSGRRQGRKAVLDHFKESLDGFDRRFDSRENPEMVEGPRVDENSVWIRWRVTYRVEGAPPFALEGEETAVISGDQIHRLEDRFTDQMAADLDDWMKQHGDKLEPGAESSS